MKPFVFVGIILLQSMTSFSLESHQVKVEAFNFIISQRNNHTFGWKDGQTPVALLGLLSARPTWDDMSSKLSFKRLEVELLTEAYEDPTLSEVDSANLAAIGGAFLAGCYDLRDVNGINLLSQLKDRLKKTSPASPAYGVISLVLCNNLKEGDLMKRIISGLDNSYRLGKACPFCVETSAIRLQALLCFIKKAKEDVKNHISRAILNNRRYLGSVENSLTGDFKGKVLETSLASQALYTTSKMTVADENRFSKSKSFILKSRRPDGSFSGSVRITASAVSTFSLFSADQINFACDHKYNERKDHDMGTSYFRVYDGVYTQQSVRFRVPVKKIERVTLLEALRKYSQDNSDTFNVKTRSTHIGERLLGINELKNSRSDRTFWKTYLIHKKDGRSKRKVLLTKSLEKIYIQDEATYFFSFEKV